MPNHPQPSIRSGLKIPLLDGTNDDLVFSRAHWNQIITLCNAILSSENWTVTDHGLILDIGSVVPPAQTNLGLNWRGLWSGSPQSPYMTFDWVQIGFGTSAGTYYSTIDNNANAPDSGIGWTQVSSSSGTWL